MTASNQEIAVHRSVAVPLTRERAFELFTARMGAFWPAGHSIGSAEIADVVVEPHVGGRWYERGVDDSECDWGRVAAWEPPGRVVLLWQIGVDWTMHPTLETDVEITFTEDGPGRTRVDLTHRHLERYGDQAGAMHAVFDSPEGWTGTLARFAALADRAVTLPLAPTAARPLGSKERHVVTSMQLARDERTDLAAFLADLTVQQWDAPTLCAGWRVRDVVAHLISYEELDTRGLLQRFVKGRFLPGRVNAVGVADYNTRGPQELLALVNDHLQPRGLTAGFGGRIALVDGMIHHQDIRRPLGMPRDIPAERLLPALDFALVAPTIGAFWRARGLRLIATDLDWTTGRGPEVRGTAEALLMAIAGRRDVLQDLCGPGQPTLAARIELDPASRSSDGPIAGRG